MGRVLEIDDQTDAGALTPAADDEDGAAGTGTLSGVVQRLRSMLATEHERAVLIVFGLSLVGGVAALVLARGLVIDDSFITFRYAQNLADGHGWAYNVGSVTDNGASSPLYVLVLAALALVRIAPTTGANIVSVLSVACAATCTFVVVRHVRSTAAGAIAATFVVVNPWFPLSRGMESSFLVAVAAALLMVAFATDVHRRQWLFGLLAGVLVLIRPDAGLLVVVVGAAIVWRDRRVPWRSVAVAAAVVGSWCLAAWVMIGTPVPATLAAKTAQGRSGLWGPRTAFLTTAWRDELDVWHMWPWMIVVFVLSAVGTVVGARRRESRALVLSVLAWAALQMVAYGVVLGVPGYWWYYAPVVYALSTLAAFGADGALALIRARWVTAARVTAVVGCVAFAVVVVRSYPNGFALGEYRDEAAWINANTPPSASVAAAEIGYLGHLTDRPIVDYLGLLDTTAASEVGRGDLRSWIYRTQPDVVVTHVPIWSYEVQSMTAPEFAGSYQLAAGGCRCSQADVDAPGADAARSAGWVFVRRAPIERGSTQPPVVTPDAFRAALRARGIVRTPEDEAAVGAVVAILIGRPDLQRAFVVDGSEVDAAAMFTWAATSGATEVPDTLGPHAAALTEMAQRVTVSDPSVMPFTDPFVPG
jgi:hypothetical protein